MSKRQLTSRIFMVVTILALLLGLRAGQTSVLLAMGAPEISDMVPHHNEVFALDGDNIVIKLAGSFTPDTQVIIEVYGNASSMTVPPTSNPTARLTTTEILRSGGLQITIPFSQMSNVYGLTSQTLSAIVATNATGTDIYYFSVVKYLYYPAYYRGGLP